MKPRFAAVYCVHDDTTWLRLSLLSIYDSVDAVVFLLSKTPWKGAPSCIEGIRAMLVALPDPDRKVEIVTDRWSREEDQRNAGLSLLETKGIEYCFVVDTDEVYDREELGEIQRIVAANPSVDCWSINRTTYWKSFRYRIVPREPCHPLVFCRVGRTEFVKKRQAVGKSAFTISRPVGHCHHFSYARSDRAIRRRIENISQSAEIPSDWILSVWERWDKEPGLENLHPTHPEAYERAEVVPWEDLPAIVRENAVSVVIPTRRREASLHRCIKSVQADLDAYPTVEVVVFRDEYEVPLGCPRATNSAVEFAKGTYIAFLGNDTIPQPGWLRDAMDTMLRSFPRGVGLVGFPDPLARDAFQHFVVHRDLIDDVLGGQLFFEGYAHNWCNHEVKERLEAKGLYRESVGASVLHSWWSDAANSPGAPYREKDTCDELVERSYADDTARFFERRAQWVRNLYRWECKREVVGRPAAIVVVTKNSDRDVPQCLEGIASTMRPIDEVVVVDDASEDGTVKEIEKLCRIVPGLQVLQFPAARGQAAAWNAGARTARSRDLIFVLPGLRMSDGWIEKLLLRLLEDADSVGPISLRQRLPHQDLSSYCRMPLRRDADVETVNRALETWWPRMQVDVGYLDPLCRAMRRTTFELFGGFDELLCSGAEDADMSWQLTRRGMRQVIATDTFVSCAEGDEDGARSISPDVSSLERLQRKLVQFYAPGEVPSPKEIWGVEMLEELIGAETK